MYAENKSSLQLSLSYPSCFLLHRALLINKSLRQKINMARVCKSMESGDVKIEFWNNEN